MSYYSPSGGSYPYSAYHPPSAGTYHAQHASGAYPTTAYSQAYPPTTVQGYGATWPYYSYYPPQQQQAQTAAKPAAARPAVGNAAQGAQHSTSAVATAATTTTQTATASNAPTTSILQATGSQRPYTTTTSYTYVPTYRDTLAAASSGGARGSRKSTFRGLFTKELRNLMYGFGDDRNPANDSVNVMEEILVEYIVDVCQSALGPGKKARLSIEDLRRALSRPADAKKLARMEELLFMQEDIKRARAQFEESDMNQATAFQS